MSNNIEGVLNEILKDYKAIALDAVKDAAHKGQDDIIKEAKKYLQLYYDSYSPKMYKRKFALKRAIKPYWADKSNNNGVSISIGVTYDVGALKGAYKSNSWYHQNGGSWVSRLSGGFDANTQSNGIPDSNWILENFLIGEHGGVQRDFNSTSTLMPMFFENELPSRIEAYVGSGLVNAIVNRL